MVQYAAIVLSFLALLALEIRFSEKGTVSIPGLFTAYWGILICIGIPLYWKTYTFHYQGFFWILLMCAVFFLSERLCVRVLKKRGWYGRETCLRDPAEKSTELIVRLVKIFLLLRLFGLVCYLAMNDIIILDLLKPDWLMKSIHRLTMMKYYVVPTRYSSLISIANTLSCTGMLLLGLYGMDFSKKDRIQVGAFAAMTFVVSMVIFASKADVIFAVLLFLTGLFARLVIEGTDLFAWTRQHKKLVLLLGVTGAALLLMLAVFIVVRSGFQKSLADGFKQYGFGMIPAFDRYFSVLRPEKLSWGIYTFYGIFSTLGLTPSGIPQGIYREMYLGRDNYATNIFTAFRSLLDDFGLVGCLAVFVLLGVLCAVFTDVCRNNRKRALAPSGLCFLLFFLLNSFMISSGTYFSLCLAHVFLFLILAWLKGRERLRAGIGRVFRRKDNCGKH